MRRAARALALAGGMSFRADPARTSGILVLSLFTPFVGVVTAYSLKVIVDAAASGDEARAMAGAGALATVVGLGMLANASGTRMMFPLKERTGLLIDRRLIELVGGIATIEHHERPAYLAQVDVLRREGHVLASSGFNIAVGVAVLLEAVATGLLLAWVDPVLLAIPLFAVPSLMAGARAERVRQQALDETADDAGVARHLFELATSPVAGKELRVYGLGPELLSRHRTVWQRADSVLDRAARRGVLWIAGGWVFFTTGYAIAIVLVVRGAVAGTATVGDVVLALTMVAQINDQVASGVGSVTALARMVAVANRVRWLAEYASGRRGAAKESNPVPDRIVDGIELRNLGFRYPGSDSDVLADVNLILPAGSTVAFVGDNGAGKSTLVKLLCRLYEPSTGLVAVDGVDLRHFAVEEWRARISAGFQDFTRFELLARETVGVGDLPFIDDVDAVAQALARAGSDDIAPRLPQGLETPLGNSFDAGSELSGGQWQKLALARAMMRPAPLLLVLDEPTAALDAETEHALFSRYSSAARSIGTGAGSITLLVSHRFSTVSMADLIVVIDGGRVVEAGSHGALMTEGGLYAELYELQARSYR